MGRRRWGLCPEKMDLARTIILLCSWAAGAGGEGRPGPLGPRGLGRDVAFRLRLPPFPSRGRPALSPGRQAAAGPLPGALSPPPLRPPPCPHRSFRLGPLHAAGPAPSPAAGTHHGRPRRPSLPFFAASFSFLSPRAAVLPPALPFLGTLWRCRGPLPSRPAASFRLALGAPRSLPGRAVRADGRLRRRKRPCLGDAVPGPRPEETPFWVLPRDGEVWTGSRCRCFSALGSSRGNVLTHSKSVQPRLRPDRKVVSDCHTVKFL